MTACPMFDTIARLCFNIVMPGSGYSFPRIYADRPACTFCTLRRPSTVFIALHILDTSVGTYTEHIV
jgi:hypothetical protein